VGSEEKPPRMFLIDVVRVFLTCTAIQILDAGLHKAPKEKEIYQRFLYEAYCSLWD
jgi:hypothetical protein